MPEAAYTHHCWNCKWTGRQPDADAHALAEPTHKVTLTSDTWHRPITPNATEQPQPGDRVTWNDIGKALFGETGSEGLLVEVRSDYPGLDGPAGHVLWESSQDTWASIACLMRAPSAAAGRQAPD